ncbi:MAG: hypothetical protein U5K31_02265 [Balneolaceae bacterium]|nr:hypothetical protein [Balneolaceae bacterium]
MHALHPHISFLRMALIWLPVFLLAVPLFPARAQAVIGARQVALGGAASALPGQRWSPFSNPALAPSDRPSLAFFAMRYYGFHELTDAAAVVHLPTGAGTWSAGGWHYGFELYRELQLRLSWSLRLGALHLGVAAAGHRVSLGGGYGSQDAWSLDAGLAAELAPGLMLGARAANLSRSAWRTGGGSGDPLHRDLAAGVSWRMAPSTLLMIDLVKETRDPPFLRGGLEVTLLPGLYLRCGADARSGSLSGGLAYQTRRFGVDLAMQRHPDPLLGLSPGMDLYLRL